MSTNETERQERIEASIAGQLGTSISNNAKLYARVGHLRAALVTIMNEAERGSTLAKFCEDTLNHDQRQSIT